MEKENYLFLPISINVTNKKIMIVGGGNAAYHKATILNRFSDVATIVAPEFHEGFGSLPFTLVQKEYESSDLTDVFLVYICTQNKELNTRIKQECEEKGILASVCDDPVLCDFTSPAIFKQDNITISVASNAQNVHKSIDIRNQIQFLVESGLIKVG